MSFRDCDIDYSVINGGTQKPESSWFSENALAREISIRFVQLFKISQSSGSTLTLLENAAAHNVTLLNIFTPGFSTAYAFAGMVVTGVVTMYSRGPSIRKKMTEVKPPVHLAFYKNSKMIKALYYGVYSMAFLSSFCVGLAAFLSGSTLVNLTLMHLFAYICTPVMYAWLSSWVPTTLAAMTALSSFYSFHAFNIEKVKKFALARGKDLYGYLYDDEDIKKEQEEKRKELDDSDKAKYEYAIHKTALFSVPVILISLCGGFFFVSHALSLIALNFGLTFLTHSLITKIAIGFMIPSFITTFCSKVDHVYRYFTGENECTIATAFSNYFYKMLGYKIDPKDEVDIPLNKNFVIFMSSLCVLSAIDIFNAGIGAWMSGSSVSRRLLHIDPDTLSGYSRVFADAALFILSASEAMQTYAFTTISMLNDMTKLEVDKRHIQQETESSLQPVLQKYANNGSPRVLKRSKSASDLTLGFIPRKGAGEVMSPAFPSHLGLAH